MIEWISTLWDFIYTFGEEHQEILIGLTVFSIIAFVAGIVLTPWLIINMPVDYFITRGQKTYKKITPFTLLVTLFKNIAGVLLMIIGVLLLFIPGPGTLTILLGVTLVDFPFKYKLELWIVRRKKVNQAINDFRVKHGHDPLQLPDSL